MKITQSAKLNRHMAIRFVPKNIWHSNISQVIFIYLYSRAKLTYQRQSIDEKKWMILENKFHYSKNFAAETTLWENKVAKKK